MQLVEPASHDLAGAADEGYVSYVKPLRDDDCPCQSGGIRLSRALTSSSATSPRCFGHSRGSPLLQVNLFTNVILGRQLRKAIKTTGRFANPEATKELIISTSKTAPRRE